MYIEATKVVTVVITMDGYQADELYKMLDSTNTQTALLTESALKVKNELMQLITKSAKGISK
tara:strand:- start:30097 stop:30282 length:186 start_codon:yes stop_codon:yes gene_type:complete